jgi:hypothetical protein
MQLDFLKTIVRARDTDPETSHAAAASVKSGTVLTVREQIVSVLKDYGPSTDEQIRLRLRDRGVITSESGARTRRSELVKAGLVLDSGARSLTRANRKTIKWRAR